MRHKNSNTPEHWRDRAKEMRKEAARATDPRDKAVMLGMADGYDRVAQEAQAKTDSKKSEPSATAPN